MNIKKIIVAASLTLASFGASAQNWIGSAVISFAGPNGYFTFGTTNGYPIVQGVFVRPGVVYSPPSVIYAPVVPQVVYPTMIVPCYNCGQYPQGNPYDPYRNHHHLQRGDY